MTSPPGRALIIEDHPLLRSGLLLLLARIPEVVVVGEAGDGAGGVALWRQLCPTLVMLDLHLPDCHGLEVLRLAEPAARRSRILVLSSDATAGSVSASLDAGVHGYFLKSDTLVELEQAIRAVLAGRMYLSPAVVPFAIGRRTAADGPPDITVLSPREREVLALLAGGLRTKEAAAQLGVSTKTAETFRRRLMGKLGLHSIAELTRYAIRQGVIEP